MNAKTLVIVGLVLLAGVAAAPAATADTQDICVKVEKFTYHVGPVNITNDKEIPVACIPMPDN